MLRNPTELLDQKKAPRLAPPLSLPSLLPTDVSGTTSVPSTPRGAGSASARREPATPTTTRKISRTPASSSANNPSNSNSNSNSNTEVSASGR